MKKVYPFFIYPDGNIFGVFIPDFQINTQGCDFAEAISMARDAIGMAGIVMQDENIELPNPSAINTIQSPYQNSILSLVDIDFTEYRKLSDTKTVRRNVSLQSWLDYAATKAGINVSAICQKALMDELHMYGPKYTA